MNGKDIATKNLLALSYVEELSYKRKAALLERAEEPSCLAKSASVVKEALGEEQAAKFFSNLDDIDGIIARLEREDICWISRYDDEYPEALLDIYDPPIMLFAKGNVAALKGDAIAVVGTRHPTRYGAKVSQEFSREFALSGLTIVSGFARGVDSIAHKQCIECGAPTIAVLGSGLDVCYPAEHLGLMQSIIDCGGLIISEYPLGTKPLQYHFPERNRIISGLSRAVFLAEAAAKSGSLITVKLAVEQGRDVFAVPGNIYAAECEGSNNVLREMPHALAIRPEDVLDALHIERETHVKDAPQLDIMENLIVEELKKGEMHFEELLAATDLSVGELTNTLFNLEMNGIVENIGGNYYALA